MTERSYQVALAMIATLGASACVFDDGPSDQGSEPAAESETESELATTRYLSDRVWSSSSNGWGPVERDRSNGERAAGDGTALKIGGTTFTKGLGVHAPSDLRFQLGGACTSLRATVGIDDESATAGSSVFQVWADGTLLQSTALLRGSSAPVVLDVDVTGRTELRLVVTDGGDGGSSDHADWGSARVICDSASARPPVNAVTSWKMLALVIRNTDVTFTDPSTGQTRRVTTRLTAAEEAGVIEAARKTSVHMYDWSGGMGRASTDVLVVNDTLRTVSRTGDGFWASPNDVSSILDSYAPDGSYDSLFVIWDPDGTSGNVPTCCFYGQGRSSSSNNATYAAIPVFGEGAWTNAAPGEAFVHEWMHGAMAYYRDERGFNAPDPHASGDYGYPSADAQGSWAAWYTAHLSGALVHPTTNIRAGVSSTVWDSGTPTRPIGTAMGPPTHLRAATGGSGISTFWTANTLADHYRLYRGTTAGSETYWGWTRNTSALDVSVAAGQNYHYVVRSASSTGVESLNGNRVSITR